MKRREFLGAVGGSAAASLVCPTAFGSDVATVAVDSLFEANSPQVLEFAERVMNKCVLDKIRPPTPPLERRWIVPGGPHYRGQWIWDTMFVVDLLSLLPDKQELIREVFHNYWDFQDRWNREAPDYAQDMITVAIKTKPQDVRHFSQIPILAWGLERVYRRNGDRLLVEQCLDRLERFHEWYWRERDIENVGLCVVGSYSGKIQHARWETFDYECNMDNLQLTPHPSRTGDGEGQWYGNLYVPGNTAYLVMGERSLARLASMAGNSGMAARRQARIDKAVHAMREHMWDDQAGTFLTVERESMEKVPVATIGSWIPLIAEVPTAAMADRMAEVLASPKWQTPLPLPTVDRSDPRWKSNSFWRGDVWPSTNYQIASGLAHYGHTDLAATIADKTIANAIEQGISEHYDSVTGKPLGVPDYCMSATIATTMLDGLSREHGLSLRG